MTNKPTRGERRRAAMIEAATAVFLEKGFAGATLDDVIQRSGGSRSTVYEQFGDKEGLFAAIITDACNRIMTPFADAIAQGRDPGSTLYDLARAYMDVLMAPENLGLFRMVIAESGRRPELGQRVFASGPEASAVRLRDYLAAETRRGRLNVRDADAAARVFLEMVKGDLHTRALFGAGSAPSPAEIDRCVRAAVKLFLDGVRK